MFRLLNLGDFSCDLDRNLMDFNGTSHVMKRQIYCFSRNPVENRGESWQRQEPLKPPCRMTDPLAGRIVGNPPSKHH